MAISASTMTSLSSAHPSSPSSVQVNPAWVDSIDAVYRLFEDPQLRNLYPSLAAKVKIGVELCEEVITELGLEHCALSFNGGKDCTVIVHMLAAVIRRLSGLSQPFTASKTNTSSSSHFPAAPLIPLPTVYITCPSPFELMESFIRASQVRYNLDLVTVPGSMKDGLIEYFDGGGDSGVPPLESRVEEGKERVRVVEGRPKRDVKAIFIGTRRTDPMGETLTPRKWTDASWPKVERIHPILDWDYSDVWDFLRCPALGCQQHEDALQGHLNSQQQQQQQQKRDPRVTLSDEENGYGTAGGGAVGVPYCRLYEHGFTSLGSTYNTFPNPLLKVGGYESKQEGCNGADAGGGGGGADAGAESFRPAWQLKDASSERAGRGDQKKKKP